MDDNRRNTYEDNLVHAEFGHGVRNLLEQDGSESNKNESEKKGRAGKGGENVPSVESTNTFFPGKTGESAHQAGRKVGLGDHSDTGSLKGAKRDICEELCDTGSTEVDDGAVIPSGIKTDDINRGLFPEFVTTEFECALEGVSECGGTKTGEEGTCAFCSDNLTEGRDHSLQFAKKERRHVRSV